LKKAAQITAWAGFSTRVETMVAMELAASCIPFRKSNRRATATRNGRISQVNDAPIDQRFSMRMPLTPVMTSSNRSTTFSRWSNTSAPAMKSIGRSWLAVNSAFMPAS